MVLHIFVGSLLPYVECLDSWIFKGKLDDPFEEVIVLVMPMLKLKKNGSF